MINEKGTNFQTTPCEEKNPKGISQIVKPFRENNGKGVFYKRSLYIWGSVDLEETRASA